MFGGYFGECDFELAIQRSRSSRSDLLQKARRFSWACLEVSERALITPAPIWTAHGPNM
jgi:hypothetical protein